MSQSTGRTIYKNAGVLMVSQSLTWTMTILLTIFLPRYLGAEGVGKYHLAASLWAIASILAAFGLDTLLTKEIARDPRKTPNLFGTSLLVRTLFFGLTAAGMMLYVQLAGYPGETVRVVAVMGVTALLTQYTFTIDAVLRGLERMEYISLGSIIAKALMTALTVALLLMGYGVLMVATVGAVIGLVHLLLLGYLLQRLQTLHFAWDPATARWMLKAAYPYLVVNIFLVLYMQVDIVIISLLVNETTIGWYAAADQLFGTLLFIPTVLMTAVFPALARLHGDGTHAADALLSKSFDMLLLLSVPIGLGILVIAQPLVVLLFGAAFIKSGPVLAVFGLVLILTYQNILLGQYYISTDRQRFWAWIMAVATVVTIPLDLVLVPWCVRTLGNGALGGALAFLVTELGMMVAGLLYLPAGTFGMSKLWLALRILLAGCLMAAAVWPVRNAFIVLPLLVGMGTYTCLVGLLRVVPAQEWAAMKRVSRDLTARLRNQAPRAVNP